MATADHDRLLTQAESLVPLLRDTAREAEQARRPLDHVIDAVRETDLFRMMVPRHYGGLEADMDTFFEVSLTLSRADASMGWLIGFYIEHNWWFCNFDPGFQDEIFKKQGYVLAPGALAMTGGTAIPDGDGYRLNGQWAWGTGIAHSTWVIAGAMLTEEGPDGKPITLPYFFAVPREETEMIDTWHMAGMCATGSNDFKIDNVLVPKGRTMSFIDVLTGQSGIQQRYPAPLYDTPMMMILALTAAIPCLGAAQRAIEEFQSQSKQKLEMATGKMLSENASKQITAAEAALQVEMAEGLMRGVLADVMEKRNSADRITRAGWMGRITHAVNLCKEATAQIISVAGAGAHRLDNPLQRCLRDVNTASNHVAFDRDSRLRDFGRGLVGLDPTAPLL